MNREEDYHIKDLCILGEVLTSLVRAKHDINKSTEECYSYVLADAIEDMTEQLDKFMGVCNTLMLNAINKTFPYDQE